MARSEWSPSMTDRWRAEDDDRDRLSRPRDWDSIDRWTRSPPRRDIDSAYRGRDLIDTDSYRPPQKRALSRDLRLSPYRRSSPSPVRHSRPNHPARGRPLEERISRPRDPSPDRAIKRRRTRSPSPARSDRWVPDPRRSSQIVIIQIEIVVRPSTEHSLHVSHLRLVDLTFEIYLLKSTHTFRFIEDVIRPHLLHVDKDVPDLLDEHHHRLHVRFCRESHRGSCHRIRLGYLRQSRFKPSHLPESHLGLQLPAKTIKNQWKEIIQCGGIMEIVEI